MAVPTNRGIPISAVDPWYLHTNSTSHTWPFSAVAELIDNAYDPDVKAKQFWIDKYDFKGHDCLVFMDNGAGLDYEKMHKMLSFGFSKKQTVKGHAPIGMYGNGFKSGSMRLGKDAIVLSKQEETMCVGLLSQTYLDKIDAENVVVPIAVFNVSEQIISLEPDCDASLRDILKYSLFNTKEELLNEINFISGPCGTNLSGTRIIIWNLRRTSSGKLEFNFTQDLYDIRIPVEKSDSTRKQNKRHQQDTSPPESKYSLRAYTSILYLKPKMQIIIRGQKVKTELISKSLALILEDKYRPNFLEPKQDIKMTFGYNTKNKEHYGVMMYYKNRLIRAYQRVACQDKVSREGVGVIGVIECDYLKPTHNKQEFNNTDEYRKTMQNLNTKLKDYWKEIKHRYRNCPKLLEDDMKKPDQNSVQCDDCLKWRNLPDGIDPKQLPEQWFCRLNPDPKYRSCSIKEEADYSGKEQPKNPKTYKQHEKEQKLQKQKQQIQRRQEEQLQKSIEAQMIVALANQNAVLEKMFSSPTQAESSSEPHVPAGTRASNNLAINNDVTSLTATPSQNKRSLSPNQETGDLKRSRISDRFTDHTTDSLPPSTAPPGDFTPSTAFGRSDNDSDNDHDIEIIEDGSTPRPKQAFDTFNIKSENVENEEKPSGNEAIVASAFYSEPTEHVSMSSQTGHKLAIKQEAKDSESQKEVVWNKNEERESQATQQLIIRKVEDLQSFLLMLTQGEMRTQTHQSMKTSSEETQDHKMQCLEAKGVNKQLHHKLNEMKTRKGDDQETNRAPAQSDELACHIETLFKEQIEMKQKLDRLEKENRALSTSCESLRKDLQETKREIKQLKVIASQEARVGAAPAEASTSGRESGTQQEVPERKTEQIEGAETCRLKELRQKVARLLITFVPALDLQQVNYNCEDIDEILSQIIDKISDTETPSSIR